MRISMVGSRPSEECMKPTILIICPGSRAQRGKLQKAFANFISVTIPTTVEFKIAAGTPKPTAGSIIDNPSQDIAMLSAFLVDIDSKGSPLSLMGMVAQIRNGTNSGSRISTIGGFILVGGHKYALTTAHMLFSKPEDSQEYSRTRQLPFFGVVDQYEWSGNATCEDPGYDWLTIEIKQKSPCLNRYWIPGSGEHVDIQDFTKEDDITDGKVLVCAGVTGSLFGTLNADVSSLVYGGMLYDVYSIALEAPLTDGDSGSWVIKNGKVCGIIFARLDNLHWAYMIPIEPTLNRIANAYTENGVQPPIKIANEGLKQHQKGSNPYSSIEKGKNVIMISSPVPTECEQVSSPDVLSMTAPDSPASNSGHGMENMASKSVSYPEYLAEQAEKNPPLEPGVLEANNPNKGPMEDKERASTKVITGHEAEEFSSSYRSGPAPSDSRFKRSFREEVGNLAKREKIMPSRRSYSKMGVKEEGDNMEYFWCCCQCSLEALSVSTVSCPSWECNHFRCAACHGEWIKIPMRC
ncbi:hypothetical protein BGZ60DRAFT_424629 [Tricladium varicosporioides]|nr:hypothetical protein BGZ60DRAFT_424629 [Hymenoscyphus varicosporioides]